MGVFGFTWFGDGFSGSVVCIVLGGFVAEQGSGAELVAVEGKKKRRKRTKKKAITDVVEVKLNKRKLISPFNHFKHGKYSSNTALFCDNCLFGHNGLGKCPFSKPGQLCVINEQVWRWVKELGIDDAANNPDALVNAIATAYAKQWERTTRIIMFSEFEGGGHSKEVLRELNMLARLHELLLQTIKEVKKLKGEDKLAAPEEVKMFLMLMRKRGGDD